MTVFVYVNTSKPAGDVDHIKVFANQAVAETCSPSPRPLPVKKNGGEGEQPASVDYLDDFLLLRVNQHHLVADGEIAVVGELRMVARQLFRHRLQR
jgi:hypothetical protein